MNTEELLLNWVKTIINPDHQRNILGILRAEPRFQTHNYFARYKIKTAKLDPSGLNPVDIKCIVIEISETDQSVQVVGTMCTEIKDLEQ